MFTRKKINERAKHLKIVNFKTARNNTRKFTEMYNKLTSSAGEKESELISKKMTEDSSNLGGISWDKLKEKGYTRFTELGKNPASFGNACDIKKGETISPHTWHTEKKEVWTTLTGRIQFYIDHDWYLELNEQLPIHKNPPTSGGDYPFTLTGGHTRWSIHSIMRTDPGLLRLQRGEPFVLISVKDAVFLTSQKLKYRELNMNLPIFPSILLFHPIRYIAVIQDNILKLNVLLAFLWFQ